MNALTTEDDIWKIVCQHVAPNTVVFIKKNNTCARIKFYCHEHADLLRKHLDGNNIFLSLKIFIYVGKMFSQIFF